jgi:hypothetical protein
MLRASKTELPTFRYFPGQNTRPAQPWMPSTKICCPEEVLDRLSYGIDLFNAQYFWESHEAFEHLWNYFDRNISQEGRFFQAIILLAAAHLKVLVSKDLNSNAQLKIRQRFHELSHGQFWGIPVDKIISQLDHFILIKSFIILPLPTSS